MRIDALYNKKIIHDEAFKVTVVALTGREWASADRLNRRLMKLATRRSGAVISGTVQEHHDAYQKEWRRRYVGGWPNSRLHVLMGIGAIDNKTLRALRDAFG